MNTQESEKLNPGGNKSKQESSILILDSRNEQILRMRGPHKFGVQKGRTLPERETSHAAQSRRRRKEKIRQKGSSVALKGGSSLPSMNLLESYLPNADAAKATSFRELANSFSMMPEKNAYEIRAGRSWGYVADVVVKPLATIRDHPAKAIEIFENKNFVAVVKAFRVKSRDDVFFEQSAADPEQKTVVWENFSPSQKLVELVSAAQRPLSSAQHVELAPTIFDAAYINEWVRQSIVAVLVELANNAAAQDNELVNLGVLSEGLDDEVARLFLFRLNIKYSGSGRVFDLMLTELATFVRRVPMVGGSFSVFQQGNALAMRVKKSRSLPRGDRPVIDALESEPLVFD